MDGEALTRSLWKMHADLRRERLAAETTRRLAAERCFDLEQRAEDVLDTIDDTLAQRALSLFKAGRVDHAVMALAFVLLCRGGVAARRDDDGDVVVTCTRPFSSSLSEIHVMATGVMADSVWHDRGAFPIDVLAERSFGSSVRPISFNARNGMGVIYSRSIARDKLVSVLGEALHGRIAAISSVLPASFVPELVSQMVGPVTHLFPEADAPAKKRRRE